MKKLFLTNPLILISATLSSCSIPDEPASQSLQAADKVVIPTRFDKQSTRTDAPRLEVTKGLLSLFSDNELKRYVKLALKNNPDLKSSLARLEEAGFNTRVARAAKRPSVNASVTYGRVRSSGINSTERSSTLDAQWEIDVWGRIEAGVQAAYRDRAALAADHEAARQSIAAQTMQAYFSLVSSEKLLGLSRRRLVSFEATETLVNRRFEAGTGDLSELSLARTDVENTRAEIEGRKNVRDQAARQLRLLTGAYPDARLSAQSYPSRKARVPAGIPSSVMMSRPDINAAYQRIIAADARVTVAHRDFYPQFPLTGSTGRRSNTLQGLSSTDFSVSSIVANFAATLVDGGELRANLGAANARAKEALADYHSVVLSAFQEVENALGSEVYLENQQAAFAEALKAAKQAEEQTQRNFESGLTEVLTLLDAKRRSFSAEESLINTEAQRFDNRVSLALSLGKGL